VPAIEKGKKEGHIYSEFHRLIDVIPRTQPGAKENNPKEIRVFYVKLSNELKDLARLRLPLNLLYKRHVVDIAALKAPNTSNPEEMKKLEADSVFAFKDPRLRHLNKNFKREEL
jgi:hypothetical protein